MHFRKSFGTIAIAAITLLVAACSPEESDAESTGGSLTFACVQFEDQCRSIAQRFTEDTGNQANFVQLGGGETVARLSAASKNPEFDAWYGAPAANVISAHELDLIEPYISENADQIPDEFMHPDGIWSGVLWGTLGFCSNTDVLEELGVDAPTSWNDLLDPKLRQNVSIAHPMTSSSAYAALWNLVAINKGDEDKAIDYFKSLHNNILQYPKSGGAPGQMAGRGEIAVGVLGAPDCTKVIEEGFTNLELTLPSDGSLLDVQTVAMVKDAPNPDAAKAFIDWALTVEGQEFDENAPTYSVPTNPEVPLVDGMANRKELTVLPHDMTASGQAKDRLINRFESEVAPQPKD